MLLDQRQHKTKHSKKSESSKNRIEIISSILMEDILPSLGQKHLWFLQELSTNNTAYNIGIALSFEGPLHKGSLFYACETLVRRHESLRMKFSQSDKKLAATISSDFSIDINQIDCSNIEVDQDFKLIGKKFFRQEINKIFNLEKGPLIRHTLLCFNPNLHILIVSFHHIIFDSSSIRVYLKELASNYEALVRHQSLALTSSTYSYKDFIVEQRSKIQGVVLDQLLEYWKHQLANVEPLILPTDKPRGQKALIIKMHEFDFSPELSQALRQLSQEKGTTLQTILFSAFGSLLYRYSGQENFLIGVPLDGREEKNFENGIGLFTNTLPIRVTLTENKRFGELVEQVKNTTRDALNYQEIPLSNLITELNIPRYSNQDSLFSVMFKMENSSLPSLHFNNLNVQVVGIETGEIPCDISLEAHTYLEDLFGIFKYDENLFKESTIQRMEEHWLMLLKSVVQNYDQLINKLPLATASEQQQLLVNWNKTEKEYPKDKTIHQLFEEQVEKTPDNIAVVYGKAKLTYKELNERANRLARYLRDRGVKEETPVAISIERGMDLIIGLLGILKAGGVCIPLDTKYNDEQLKLILIDTKLTILLTTQKSVSIFPWLQDKNSTAKVNLLIWEDVWPIVDTYDQGNLISLNHSESPAYLIYTSASTGKPSGIYGTHNGTINRLAWSWQAFPVKPDDVYCQKTSSNFVDHIDELFSSLLQGIPLILLSTSTVNNLNIAQMIEDITVHNVSRIVLSPSLLGSILQQETSKLAQLQNLKYVFCSGEALPLVLADHFYELLPWAQLINVYRPSEVAADATYYCVPSQNIYDIRLHSNIRSHFDEGLQKLKTEFQIAKDNLITTPNIELDELKTQFKNAKIPLLPKDHQEYYQALQQNILPYVVNTASPLFIGHMTSALPAFIHDFSKLMSMLNQNVVKIETSKAFTFLEREAIAMLHQSLYEQPDDFYEQHIQNSMSTLGIVVSNGTIANITALWVARNHSFPPDETFKGVPEEGIEAALKYYGYNDSVILVSPLLHYSFEKAASLLGIGKSRIHHLPLTSKGTVDTVALRQYVNYCQKEKKHITAIIGIAGATETGSIDPLTEMAEIAHEFNIHFHVDAAFGGPVIFADKYKHLLKGIERADSITLCGHKQLYLPMGISICFFRDPKKIKAIYNTADYQATIESFDFGKASPEGSRPAVSLLLHASLHILGKQGYEQLIIKGIDNAKYLRSCILGNDAFELIGEPVINIVNYRYIPKKLRKKAKAGSLSPEENEFIDRANMLLQTEQFKAGKTFISKTRVPSSKYNMEILTLRSVLANPLTNKSDINQVLNNQLEIASVYIENGKKPLTKDLHANNIIKIEVARVSNKSFSKSLTVPIGQPISNTKVYVLDRYLTPLPLGVVGELYVGSDNLVKGYCNRPDLTAEKFVDNPFQTKEDREKGKNEKLYKTGDLARWLSNGNLEYIGSIETLTTRDEDGSYKNDFNP